MFPHIPEQTAFQNAQTLAVNLGHSMSLDLLVRSAQAYEAEMSDKGHGTPPLENTVEIALMWGAIAEQAMGEH
jgi:hypothetical protein